MMPVTANESIIDTKKDIITLEYATIDINGYTRVNQISLSENDLTDIQNKLSTLIEELQLQNNNVETLNILKSYLNVDKYPILSRIFSNLFNLNFIGKRKLVVSQGIGPNLNPFKDSKTAIVKPFTTWLYSDSDNILPIPSATGILSINPFKIQTYMGSQFGFMLRFRGIYINIGQTSSMQSYTFFIGTARHIRGLEFTPLF
jgi:hypothetical protein